jgi:hypothetical protein
LSACAAPTRPASIEAGSPLPAPRPAAWVAEDRAALAALTAELGQPVPATARVDRVTLDDTRADLGARDVLGGVLVRAAAHRDQVHTLELNFAGPCMPACAGRVRAALDDWLGPPTQAREGNAFYFHYSFDTSRVTFEHYPRRPALSRVVMICQPLADHARGRPEGLRPRRPGLAGPLPRCRPIPVASFADTADSR